MVTDSRRKYTNSSVRYTIVARGGNASFSHLLRLGLRAFFLLVHRTQSTVKNCAGVNVATLSRLSPHYLPVVYFLKYITYCVYRSIVRYVYMYV